MRVEDLPSTILGSAVTAPDSSFARAVLPRVLVAVGGGAALRELDLSDNITNEAEASLLAHVLSQPSAAESAVERVRLWKFGLWLPVKPLRGRTMSSTIDLGLPRMSGYLMKQSMHLKWWRKRFCTLDAVERVLLVHADESRRELKLSIPLADLVGCQREPRLHDSSLSFVLRTRLPGLETIALCADNPVAMEEWLDALHVNISNNRLQMVDATFIGCMLRHNSACSYLKLHAVTLPVQELRGSSEVVGADRLTALDLCSGRLHMLDVKVIEELLVVNRALKFLVLSGAGLPVAKLHRAHTLSLRSSRPKLSNVDANVVGRLLKASRLLSLDLSGNAIGAGGVGMLAWGLRGNKALHTLQLSHNRIGSQGLLPLVEALSFNLTLRVLALAHNGLGARGAAALATLLTINGAIVDLDVRGNGLAKAAMSAALAHKGAPASRTGGLLVASTEASNPRGQTDWRGFEAMCDALGGNDSLTALNIAGNALGRTAAGLPAGNGVLALANALLHNSALTSLDMYENVLADEGTQSGLHKLADAIGVNEHLTSLNGICTCGEVAFALRREGLQLHETTFISRQLRDSPALSALDLSDNRLCWLFPGVWTPGAMVLAESIGAR